MTPLLLGGSGRSGTTLLARLISTHSDVTTVPETRFLVDPGGIYDYLGQYHNWTPYSQNEAFLRLRHTLRMSSDSNSIDAFLSKLEVKYPNMLSRKIASKYSSLKMSKYSPNFQNIFKNYLSDLSSFEYQMSWVGQEFLTPKKSYFVANDYEKAIEITRNYLDLYFHDVCSNQDAKFYFEKNTWNILFIPKIMELWPEFKLVNIFRNPYEVVKSYTTRTWMPKDLIQSAEIYVRIMNKYFDDKKGLSNSHFLDVRFEELLSKPHRTMKNIYSFFGLNETDDNWENVVLNMSKSTNFVDPKIKMLLSKVSGFNDIVTKLGYDQ